MIDPITAATGAAGWLWDKYGVRALGNVAEKARAEWAEVNWAERERRYRSRLSAEHSTTKLLGNPKEIQLDRIYTDVLVLDEVSAFRRLDVEDLKKDQFSRTGVPAYVTRKPLLEIATTSQRLYILGKPGAGKSTFLRTVVRLCCDGTLAKTAIFVPLNRWSDGGKTLEDFITHEFAICEFPDAAMFVNGLLESGGAIVLFDGLDEVSNVGTRRKEAIRALSEFSRKYPNSQMILTCRTAATEYSFDKFTYVEIADFTKEQQKTFIRKWYADRPENQAKLLHEWDQKESEDLVDLARTPLLLALLCLAYDATLTFPRRRIELYEESVNALLRRWDSSRDIARDEIYRGLSHNRKEQMLRRIGLETFKEADIFIPKRKLVQIIARYLEELPSDDIHGDIDGELVLRSLEAQHGLMVERANGIYSFSHLTIHEYFAAKKVVESTRSDEIVALMRAHAGDDQWREVILMVSSILDDGRFLIDAFFEILKELSQKHPAILTFVDAAHSFSRQQSASRTSRNVRARQTGRVITAQARVIVDCCVTVAANMRTLGLGERYLEFPRRIAAALQTDPELLARHFAGVHSIDLAKSYFRLAALITDCLTLTALPERKSYLLALFDPIRPLRN